jgi:ubiquitin C-terminal hydrolase
MSSQVVCRVCSTSSASFEPFTALSLPLPRLKLPLCIQPEYVSVVVTVLRKMPRLSQLHRLQEHRQHPLTAPRLKELYR